MTQPWFQVFADLPGHRKVGKLRDALGLKNRYEAVGLLICLWSWAAVHAPSGELDDISPQDLADAAGWRKAPKKFRDALVASGLVDQDGDKLRLHDWDDHQGMFQDALAKSKANHAERQRRYRERKKREREMAQRRDYPIPDNDNRDITRDATVTFNGDASDAPTSSSTVTNTLPISKSVVVGHPVHSNGGDGDREILVFPSNAEEAAGWNELRCLGGEIGQGVLTLTGWQDADLLERLGLDGYNHYCRKLVAWVQRTGAQVDHYREILKWWREDTQRTVPPVQMGDYDNGPDIIWEGSL